MKRTIIAAALLAIAVAVNVFCAFWITDVFDELALSLEGACADMRAGDVASASEKLEDFNEILERNEHGISLFIRRELVYAIALSGSTLTSYATEEHAEDFCAEASRTLETVRTVRGSMFTVS